MKNLSVLGIGNALVDIITFLDSDDLLGTFSLPRGSMQLVDADMASRLEQATGGLRRVQASGGSASNTIHGLAHLGISTGYIGRIGKDELGDFFRTDMLEAGIRPNMLYSSLPTGCSRSMISGDGERTMATFLGAAVELSSADFRPDDLAGYGLLHLEGYLVFNGGLFKWLFELAQSCGLRVSLDLASYNVVEAHLSFLHALVKEYNPVLFANEEEARAFTGKSDPEEALAVISGICDTAVVKTGARGSLVWHKGRVVKTGATKANCLDTTGAGDLYAAGFLFGFCRDLNPEACGFAGALLAARVIEVPGAKIPLAAWPSIKVTLEKELGIRFS